MNAARDNIPLLLAAGRTPITETGHIASRNRPIHWGQESFDQGGMVREFTNGTTSCAPASRSRPIVDRALDIAMSEPRGPVYLTLPREVLTDAATAPRRDTAATARRDGGGAVAGRHRGGRRSDRGRAVPADRDLRARPLAGGVCRARALAEEFALPVVQSEPNDLNLPTNHPMNLGFDMKSMLPRADVVWCSTRRCRGFPRRSSPGRDAKVIHISPDPLATQYPFRDFEADLLVAGTTRGALPHVREACAANSRRDDIEKRRKAVAALREEMLAAAAARWKPPRARTPISTSHIAACLNELKTEDAIIVNELGVPMSQLK